MTDIERRENRELTPFFPVEEKTVKDVIELIEGNRVDFTTNEESYIKENNEFLSDLIDLEYKKIEISADKVSFMEGAMFVHRALANQAAKNGTTLPIITPDFINSFLKSREEDEKIPPEAYGADFSEVDYTMGKVHELRRTDRYLGMYLLVQGAESFNPIAFYRGGTWANAALKSFWELERLERRLGR